MAALNEPKLIPWLSKGTRLVGENCGIKIFVDFGIGISHRFLYIKIHICANLAIIRIKKDNSTLPPTKKKSYFYLLRDFVPALLEVHDGV